MADDRLETFVPLGVLGLPEFDRPVGTRRDQHVKTVNLGANELSNFTLVRLRRVKFNLLMLLALLDKVLAVN